MAKHFQVDTGGTLTTNLVSYWKFEGDSTDFFGTTNGTDTSITYSSGNGKVNQGAGFNGTSSKIAVTQSWSQAAFSMAGWFKFSTGSGFHYMFNVATAGTNQFFFFAIADALGNGRVDFGIGKGGVVAVDCSPATTYGDGAWHFFVFTYDGTTSGTNCNLYIDGATTATASGSYTATATAASGTQYFGTANGTSNFFTGDLDEWGLWSKVLSSTEITDLYNSGSGQTMVSATAFTRTMSDSILIGASRTITNGRVASFFRTVSDSISVAASRVATVGKGIAMTMSDSLMNAASRFASVGAIKGFIRSMTDSIMTAASRSATVARLATYGRTMSDAIMNGASRLATVTRVHGFVRTLSDSMMVARGRILCLDAYVNGLLIQFTSKFSSQGTSFGDKYAAQGTTFTDKFQKQDTIFDDKFC